MNRLFLILHQLISIAFFLAIAILCLYSEMITPYVFAKMGGTFDGRKLASLSFTVGYAFLCFLVIPAIISKWVFKDRLSNLGLCKPSNPWTAVLMSILALFILLPLMHFFSLQPQCQAYYNLHGMSIYQFVAMHILLVPIYYFSEEFFFRGFLFLGLQKKIGAGSYWITEILFIIAHYNKPLFEIILSIPGGFILSFITAKTRSIYPALFVHFTLGLFLNIWVNYLNVN